MSNEPVAWMAHDNSGASIKCTDEFCIPLYTHPAKTLTDEEILDFINAFCTDMGDYWDLNENNAVPMIRAILRKASKK